MTKFSEETEIKLKELYLVQKIGSYRIAKRFNVSKPTVLRWLKWSGISIRKGKEAHKYKRKDVWDKNGRINHLNGYMRLWNHELKKYEWEHLVIWRKYNGTIPKGYSIHHKNEQRDDNRIENLELLSTSVHQAMHTLKRWKEGGKKAFGH